MTAFQWLVFCIAAFQSHLLVAFQNDSVSGNGSIQGRFSNSDIVITTTNRLAGAIHSLKWNGKEFIDSTDHGRQLQSASNFDVNSRFTGETFNPTEAGSRFDGAGANSTSKLLKYSAKTNRLRTTSQMAFWLRPGEKSAGNPAKNRTKLSNHLLTKWVTIGVQGQPNVIQYDVTFGLPSDESHRYAQFEALTGYMPAEFSQFFTIEKETQKVDSVTDGPGEQRHPLIFTTKDRNYAMGIYSPDQPSVGYEHAGYGRFRFKKQKVVKWNCVFRVRSKNGVPIQDYKFRNYVVVGDFDTVKKTMIRLFDKTPN